MEEKYITYKYNGKFYDVPESFSSRYEEEYPDATIEMHVGEKVYDVPLEHKSVFLDKYSNASYTFDNTKEQETPEVETPAPADTTFTVDTSATEPIPTPEKKDTLGSFFQKVGQGYSNGMIKPENYSGVKAAPEQTATIDEDLANTLIENHEEKKAEIDNAIKRLDEEYKANKPEEQKKSFWNRLQDALINAENFDDPHATRDKVQQEYAKRGQDFEDAILAKEISDNIDKKVEQYQDPAKTFFGGVGQGFVDSVLNLETWDQSVGLKRASRVYEIAKKLDNGGELTEGEQLIVDALVDDMATNVLAQTFGRGYKAGKVTGESLPFMIETMLNPASGFGEEIAEKFGKKILKEVTNEVTERLAKKGVSKATSFAVGKAVGKTALYGTRLAADVAGASVMSATTSLPRVATDALNRLSGEVDYVIADDGTLQFAGFKEGEDSALKAAAKAFGSNTIDHFSEMVGNYFGPLGHRAGRWTKKEIAKAADYFGADKIAKYMRTMTPNGFGAMLNDFMEATQWHGNIGEFSEEIVGGVLNALIVGDQKLTKYDEKGNLNDDYLFSKDNLIDTLLGVSIMGGTMSALKTLGYTTTDAQINEAVEKAKANLEGHVSAKELGMLEAFANNPFGVSSSNLAPFFAESRSKEDKEAIGKYLEAVMKKQGYEISKNASMSGTQQGLKELRKAYSLGQNMTEADMYDVTQMQNDATNNEFIQEIYNNGYDEYTENGVNHYTPEQLKKMSSFELYQLSESGVLTQPQKDALKQLATTRNVSEGLNNKLHAIAKANVDAYNQIATNASNGETINVAKYDGKKVYIKGDIDVNNGKVVKPANVSGHPVEIVDSMTGNTITVDSSQLSSVEKMNTGQYLNDSESAINFFFNQRWNQYKDTMSSKAKLNEVQQMVGAKTYINSGGNMIEVEVQQILPNGEVVLKGKKGDLGGQSTIRVDADAFYDSLSRDSDGNIISADQTKFRSQTENIMNAKPDRSNYVKNTQNTQQAAQPTTQQTAPIAQPTTEQAQPATEPVTEQTETPAAPVTEQTEGAIEQNVPVTETEPEIEDFNGMDVDILMNGVPVSVSVTNQDNSAGKINYTYTDSNNVERAGSATISDFRQAFNDAKTYKEQQNTEQVNTETPQTDVTENVSATETTETDNNIPDNEETEVVDFDALFENDKDAYLTKLQEMLSHDDAIEFLNGEIEEVKKEISAIDKSKTSGTNERMENFKKKKALQEKIDIFNGMIERLTAAPQTNTEEVTETEQAPATPTTEPVTQTEETSEPVVDETTETPVSETENDTIAEAETPAPVAPHPVDDPVDAAKKREEKLVEFLGLYGVSPERKADAARRAGKEVADMFATYEEFKEYDDREDAADLGEYYNAYKEGVKDSFENRKKQNNSGNSQQNSVSLNAPNNETNGENDRQDNTQNNEGQQASEGVVSEGHSDNSGDRGSDNGGSQAESETAPQGEQTRNGENRTEEVAEEKYPARNGDVTWKDLVDTFGFRSILIPPSQHHVYNAIYDVMMEMAKMLGISPKSLSHGGTLGFDSVGSRVSESTDAQYGPYVDRSNKTTKGTIFLRDRALSGMLHEWWHSLDHMLQFWDSGERGYATTVGSKKFTGRKEVYDALLGILRAIKQSGHIDRINNSNFYSKGYLKEKKEQTARAFEEYIIGKFAEKGIVIENIEKDNSASQPTAEEMAVIAPAFDKLFEVLHEKEGKKEGSSILYDIRAQLAQNDEVKEELGRFVSEWITKGGNFVIMDSDAMAQALEREGVNQNAKRPRRTILNRHLTAAEKQRIQKYILSLPLSDIRSTPYALMTRNYVYVFNTHRSLYDENTTQKPIGDGFEILHRYDMRTLSQEAQQELNRYKNDEKRENLDRLLQVLESEQRGGNYGSPNTSESRASVGHAGLDAGEHSKQSESNRSNNGGREYSAEIQKLETPDGVIYGFVKDGVVYLDPSLINPNTAVHEYTHLWDNALMQLNPALWEKGKSLMKQTPIWDEVINDQNYADIKDNEDLVASEVHSRLVGTKGAERLNQLEKDARAGSLTTNAKKLSILGRLREWLNEATKWLKDSFAEWNKAEIESLTLTDFLNMPLRDLANFKNLPASEMQTTQYSIIPEGDLKDKLQKEIDNGEYITLYRAVRKIDGKYYSPKMSKLGGVGQEIVLGQLEQSDERPDLAYPVQMKDGSTKYKVNLDGSDPAGTGLASRSTNGVDYNPYIHASDSMMNDQFTAAFAMPELTVIEVRVPKSELTSEYHAEHAARPVGLTPWKSGTVDLKLPKDEQRNVYLSRYDMPVRELSTDEIADHIATKLVGNGLSIPYNLVTPQVAEALLKRGVDVSEKPSGTVPKGQNEVFAELKKKVIDGGLDNNLIESIKEKAAIRKKAIANGTFMKAPNGQSTNLSENQWLTVRTTSFMNWFGDWMNDPENSSKVLDENGEPRVVYHGTSWDPMKEKAGKAVFDEYRVGQNFDNVDIDNNFFFTASDAAANGYGNVIPVFLNIRNMTTHTIRTIWNGEMDELDAHSVVVEAHDFGDENDIVDEVKNSDGTRWTIKKVDDSKAIEKHKQDIAEWEKENNDRIEQRRKEIKEEKSALDKELSEIYEEEYKSSGVAETLKNMYAHAKLDINIGEYNELERAEKNVANAFIEMYLKTGKDELSNRYKENREKYGKLASEDLLYTNYREGIEGFPKYDESLEVESDYTLADVYALDNPNQIKSATENTTFNPENLDIRYRKADTQNAAIDNLAGEPKTRAIERAVNTEAKKLGVSVIYRTREEMPDGHKNDKGYFNTNTGEIVICSENATSVADAIQTILHEAVAHKGLRQLMGEKFNEFINRVYNSLDAKTKAKVDALATAEYKGNTAVAMEEYMASLAENENFAENSVWDKIKSIFTDIINSILGRNDIKIGDNELRYILRASYNNMVNPRGMESVRGWAQDQMMRESLGINQAETPELMSRTGVDPTEVAKSTAAAVYDNVVNSVFNEFQRQFQDAYQPVRVAIDAIQAETGNIPIEDYENYLLIQNQSSSRSRVEIDNFQRKYYSPIIEHINKIVNDIMKARGLKKRNKKARAAVYKEVVQYLIAKHGLERNEYYQTHKTRGLTAAEQKPLLDDAKRDYDDRITQIDNDATLTDAEKDLEKRKALDDYNNLVTDIKTRQVADMRDYSGLTSLFGMDASDFQLAENEARRVVNDFEKAVGNNNINSLWTRINSATNNTLKHSYESGMISRQQYDDIKAMFKFYIPLRGFDETTAEDVYSYARFEGNRFNPAVQTAKGRTSIADDPIATIMNMAESEIAQGNKNRAKQALYNYLLNRASANGQQNSLMNLEDVWYTISTDANGNTVHTIAAPDHKNGETYEMFENRMQALAAQNLAAKSKKGKVDVGMRFQKKQNADAHYVYLKVNGVDKAIYINGDPKAADAINGNYQQKPNAVSEKVRAVNRNISSTFTNYSIGFTIRNYFRDLIYSRLSVDIKEKGAKYKFLFRKNWYVGNVPVMMKMLHDYRSGKFDGGNLSELQQSFVDFMNNGGQTGYTLINSVENRKAELQRAIERMQKGVEKGGIKDSGIFRYTFGAVEFLNEAMELRTRFAAFKTARDMGKGIHSSISDAKEITVNFNTKGAQDGKGIFGMMAQYFGWSKYFFNASVQGVQNLAAMAKKSPIKFCSAVGTITSLGFFMPIIQSAIMEALGGDDDDEYWNIPEYDRQNNLCIVTGKGKYAKIPLPIGFREMYAIGDMVSAMMFDKKFQRDVEQVGMDMANKVASIVLPINPLESTANGLNIWASIGNVLAPSSAQFIIQNMTNTDWKGAPLQKEYTYNENDPQWTKAFNSNPMWMKSLSKWCNENINLDGDYKGMDWSPEKLDNTLSNMLGGVYAVIKQGGQLITTALNDDKEFSISNVPLASAVVGEGADDKSRFYDAAYYEMQDYYNKNLSYIKRTAKDFGYGLDDVFAIDELGNGLVGAHHPAMRKIYDNDNFKWMQSWYLAHKGSGETDEYGDEILGLDQIHNKMKNIERNIEKSEDEATAYELGEELKELKELYEKTRTQIVDYMLKLD